MVEIPPTDGPGRDAQWRRMVERRLSAMETARKARFLTVSDDAGVDVIRIGDLNGAGDYGVEVQGGRLRALDAISDQDFDEDVTITSPADTVLSLEFTPPTWALLAAVTIIGTVTVNNGGGTDIELGTWVDTIGAADALAGQQMDTTVWANSHGSIVAAASGVIDLLPQPFSARLNGLASPATSDNVVQLQAQVVYLR